MREPGFWDDQERAARISTEHARVSRRLERYRRLSQEYEDAAELLAMDGDMAAEIESSIVPLPPELEQLQEDAPLRGEDRPRGPLAPLPARPRGPRPPGFN